MFGIPGTKAWAKAGTNVGRNPSPPPIPPTSPGLTVEETFPELDEPDLLPPPGLPLPVTVTSLVVVALLPAQSVAV